jgi:hypothetical protein
MPKASEPTDTQINIAEFNKSTILPLSFASRED